MYIIFMCLGEVRGGYVRGLLLPKFGHRGRTLCQIQTAGGAVDHPGQELAIFPAGGRPSDQPQVVKVQHHSPERICV